LLKRAGDNLTRENVMKQATSLKNVPARSSCPELSGNTSPTDYRVNKQLQIDEVQWRALGRFRPIIEDDANG